VARRRFEVHGWRPVVLNVHYFWANLDKLLGGEGDSWWGKVYDVPCPKRKITSLLKQLIGVELMAPFTQPQICGSWQRRADEVRQLLTPLFVLSSLNAIIRELYVKKFHQRGTDTLQKILKSLPSLEAFVNLKPWRDFFRFPHYHGDPAHVSSSLFVVE